MSNYLDFCLSLQRCWYSMKHWKGEAKTPSNDLALSFQDGYQLAWELENAWEQSIKSGSPIDIDSSLRR